jgi:hypothetical protein
MLKVTDERFIMAKDFNLDDFMRHSFKVMHDELYTVNRGGHPLNNFPLGKPPALPGDSQSLTFPGIDKLRKIRKPPSCEPVKVQERGGFQWTTSRV